MAILNARQLHNETSAVLDEVAKGQSFQIERYGRLVGELRPSTTAPDKWSDIMAEVWAAHKRVRRTTRNPVLAERARRRR